jgi:hypothetical protein
MVSKKEAICLTLVILCILTVSAFSVPTAYTGKAPESDQGSSSEREGLQKISTDKLQDGSWTFNEGYCPDDSFCVGKSAPKDDTEVSDCETDFCSSDYYCYKPGSIVYSSKRWYCAQSWEEKNNAWVQCDTTTMSQTTEDGKYFCKLNLLLIPPQGEWVGCNNNQHVITSQKLYLDGTKKAETKNSGCCKELNNCIGAVTGCYEEEDFYPTINDPNEKFICQQSNWISCDNSQNAKFKTIFDNKYICNGNKWVECTSEGDQIEEYYCQNGKWESTIDCSLDVFEGHDSCQEICNSFTDEDMDGFQDCSDSDCWDDIECLNQPCGGTVDTFNEMSVTEQIVIWSYSVSEIASGLKDANEAPQNFGCCKADNCAFGSTINGKCINNEALYNQNNPKLICGSNNDWDACGLVSTYNINKLSGELSDGGKYYCDGSKWIKTETNCSDGEDNGGIDGFADCLDPTCHGKDNCEFKTELTCHDGIDNDADLIGNGYVEPTLEELIEIEAEAAKQEKKEQYQEDIKTPTIEELKEEVGESTFEHKFNGCSQSECFDAPIENKGIVNSVKLEGNENSYVKLSASALDKKEHFSIAMWVNTKDQKYSGILSAANEDEDNEFLIYNPKKLTIYLKGDLKETNIDLTKGSEWKHLVVTRHFKTIKVYVDGVQKPALTFKEKTKGILNVEQLILGQDQDWSQNTGFTLKEKKAYKGYIDEFKIYDRVLTNDEIKKLKDAEGIELILNKNNWVGDALALPGQQREPSFLRKAWNKVKSVFNRDEAIVGQAGGYKKSSINSCNRKTDCNPGLDCINGKCTEAAKKSTNNNCPPGKTCADPECVGKIVTITSDLAQPKKYLCADKETNCNDGFDNDANGDKDCGDKACDGQKIKWLVGYEIVNGNYDYNKPIEKEAYCQHEKETNCDDDWDNDGDQVQDCADEDCWGTKFCNVKEGNCQDGSDNDGDGFEDCADHPDCDEEPACNPNACTNNLDDDKDGFTNCWDSQCTGKQGKDFHNNINNYHFYNELGICEYPMSGESLCADGFDNDADGLIDCSDPNCKGKTGSPHQLCDKNNVWGCEIGKTGVCEDYFNEGETSCTDKYDNDGDNLADCYDSDCINTPACQNWIAPNWWGSGVEGTDCFDSDCKGVLGPANHSCCFNINDCLPGNVCSGNQCHEIVCGDNTDNDKDGLIDCKDNDCDRLPCGENSKCFSNKCVKKAEAEYATGEEIKTAFTITYQEIFEDLKSTSQIVKGEGDCNTVCGNQKSLFGEGAGIGVCTCIE